MIHWNTSHHITSHHIASHMLPARVRTHAIRHELLRQREERYTHGKTAQHGNGMCERYANELLDMMDVCVRMLCLLSSLELFRECILRILTLLKFHLPTNNPRTVRSTSPMANQRPQHNHNHSNQKQQQQQRQQERVHKIYMKQEAKTTHTPMCFLTCYTNAGWNWIGQKATERTKHTHQRNRLWETDIKTKKKHNTKTNTQ